MMDSWFLWLWYFRTGSLWKTQHLTQLEHFPQCVKLTNAEFTAAVTRISEDQEFWWKWCFSSKYLVMDHETIFQETMVQKLPMSENKASSNDVNSQSLFCLTVYLVDQSLSAASFYSSAAKNRKRASWRKTRVYLRQSAACSSWNL